MNKRTGKISAGFQSVLIIALCLTSCEKESDEPSNLPEVGASPVAWAVGYEDNTNHATVLFSADSGSTWIRQGAGSNALQGMDASNLYAIDSKDVWVVGSNRTIARTTDGGNSWEKVNSPPVGADVNFNCISIFNETDIWISGGGTSSGIVCKSVDKGDSWTIMDTSLFQGFLMQGILAINSQVVYTVGSNSGASWNGRVARTLDGGNTWDTISLDNNKWVDWIDVTASDENHVTVYGGQCHYAYTTDGGESWTTDSIPIGGVEDINHLIMLDNLNWWGACDMDNIRRTTDGGLTWSAQQSAGPGNMHLMGIDAYNDQLALITGQSAGWPQGGKILQTKDGGNTWICRHTADIYLVKVAFASR